MSEAAAIILAAGKSTRMGSDRPKVLHEICGRPMLSYVLNACRLAGADRLLVVVGFGRQEVIDRFSDDRDITWVEQAEQRGTGHAVLCCREALGNPAGPVLVVAGDMPLVRRETLADLLRHREATGHALAMATTELEDPAGYGRIVRDVDGQFLGIVEERHCTDEQRAIREVNVSYYCFDARSLFDTLEAIAPHPASGEIYLTEAVPQLRERGMAVSADVRAAAEDAMGINSRLDLARVGRVMQDRIQLGLMSEGVTICDPDNTWIEADVTVGRDTEILPFSFIEHGATVGERCRIGPFALVGGGQVIPPGSTVRENAAHGGTRS